MNTPEGTYERRFEDVFLNTNPRTFGNSHQTEAEKRGLFGLREMLDDNEVAVQEQIREYGLPVPSNLTADDVAIAGAANACGVAIKLAKDRGPEGAKQTFLSYVTKNYFDRKIGATLAYFGNPFIDSWKEKVHRESMDISPDIEYPYGVHRGFMHGVSTPHRYLPVQTLRNLNFARINKLEPATATAMGIEKIADSDRSVFDIDWKELVPVIANASDHVKLAGDLGAKIGEQLLKAGLSVEQVAAILNKSYSIRGMIKEHGDVPEIRAVRKALLTSLSQSDTASLRSLF